MLSLYRTGLQARRAAPWGEGTFRFLRANDDVVAFERGETFACFVNFGPDPVALPAGAEVLIGSHELQGGALPQDTTVWLRQAKGHSNAQDTDKEGR